MAAQVVSEACLLSDVDEPAEGSHCSRDRLQATLQRCPQPQMEGVCASLPGASSVFCPRYISRGTEGLLP